MNVIIKTLIIDLYYAVIVTKKLILINLYACLASFIIMQIHLLIIDIMYYVKYVMPNTMKNKKYLVYYNNEC
jgi:hypothetical protein